MAAITEMEKRFTDLSFIRENSFNNNEFILEMIALFIATTPQMLEEMQNRTLNKEWKQLAQVAHKLKAQVQTFGMDEASQLIGQVEAQALAQQKLGEIQDLVTRIVQLCNGAINELVTELAQLKGN